MSVGFPPLAGALSAFGVPATITTAPGEDPISTTGFWLSPREDPQPFGSDFKRREPRRVFVVARSAVPKVPRGAILVAADEDAGATTRTWQVDGLEQSAESDVFRLIVLLIPDRP